MAAPKDIKAHNDAVTAKLNAEHSPEVLKAYAAHINEGLFSGLKLNYENAVNQATMKYDPPVFELPPQYYVNHKGEDVATNDGPIYDDKGWDSKLAVGKWDTQLPVWGHLNRAMDFILPLDLWNGFAQYLIDGKQKDLVGDIHGTLHKCRPGYCQIYMSRDEDYQLFLAYKRRCWWKFRRFKELRVKKPKPAPGFLVYDHHTLMPHYDMKITNAWGTP